MPTGLRLTGTGIGPGAMFTDVVPGPYSNKKPSSLTGTPQDDVLTFGFDKFLDRTVQVFWEGHLAEGIRQRRLNTGELVLEARRGTFLRAEWDVRDRRDNTLFTESATGLITMTCDRAARREQWTLTLWRGDYLLRNGVLELPPGTEG